LLEKRPLTSSTLGRLRPRRGLARAAETGAGPWALGLGARDEYRAQRSAAARPGGKRDSLPRCYRVLQGVTAYGQGRRLSYSNQASQSACTFAAMPIDVQPCWRSISGYPLPSRDHLSLLGPLPCSDLKAVSDRQSGRIRFHFTANGAGVCRLTRPTFADAYLGRLLTAEQQQQHAVSMGPALCECQETLWVGLARSQQPLRDQRLACSMNVQASLERSCTVDER